MARFGVVAVLALAALLPAAAGAGSTDGWVAVQQTDLVPHVVLVHPDGTGAHAVGRQDRSAADPSWSPDGSLVAFDAGTARRRRRARAARGTSSRPSPPTARASPS